MAEQIEFAFRPEPFVRRVPEVVRAEIRGAIVILQRCSECNGWTDQKVTCKKCQFLGELCR